jgi:hypothetical protein
MISGEASMSADPIIEVHWSAAVTLKVEQRSAEAGRVIVRINPSGKLGETAKGAGTIRGLKVGWSPQRRNTPEGVKRRTNF